MGLELAGQFGHIGPERHPNYNEVAGITTATSRVGQTMTVFLHRW